MPGTCECGRLARATKTQCHLCYQAGRYPAISVRYACLYATVDEVVVERLMEGEPVRYTSFERREAVRRLRARGRSGPQIAALLGIHNRQVWRDINYLAKEKAPA